LPLTAYLKGMIESTSNMKVDLKNNETIIKRLLDVANTYLLKVSNWKIVFLGYIFGDECFNKIIGIKLSYSLKCL
jgi:hypothetical protein